MLRVLHIFSSLDERDGGPLRAVLDLSAHAMTRGLDSELVGVGPLRIRDNLLSPSQIHAVAAALPGGYQVSWELRPWLAENLPRFDAVVIHGMWLYPNIVAWRECSRLGIPYAYFPHGMLDQYSIFGAGSRKALKKRLYLWLIESRVIAGAAAVWFTAARERLHACQIWPSIAPRSTVIPYGNSIRQSPPLQPAEKMYLIPPRTKVVLFLGRVHPKKNVHFLIQCWNAARIPEDFQLWIVGPCEQGYRAQLESLAQLSKMPDRIRFLFSFVAGEDKRYLLSASEWFVLPSLQENFGNSVMESVAAGTPVAISSEVYLADQFPQDAEILPLEQSAWVRFFEDRMPNRRWRNRRSESDQAAMSERFDVDRVVNGWIAAIRELAGPA